MVSERTGEGALMVVVVVVVDGRFVECGSLCESKQCLLRLGTEKVREQERGRGRERQG